MENLNEVGSALFDQIVNPAVLLFSAASFVWFLYGVLNFFIAKFKEKPEEMEAGKSHMLWGLVGVFLIYSASGIFSFFYNLFLQK